MNGLGISAKVAFGYGKAGSKLGLPHTLYRPTAPLTPALAPQNRMRGISFLSSATPDASFRRPSKYGEQIRFGLFDTRRPTGMLPIAATRPSDYITGPTGTFFIASQDPDEIPMVVQCNAVLSVVRPAGNTGSGVQVYGGRVQATDMPLITSWPAALVLGGRTQTGKADLPADVQVKGFQGLFPAWPGLVLRSSDRVSADDGRNFTVSAAESSDLGWRCDLILSNS